MEEVDRILFFTFLTILFAGILILASVSVPVSQKRFGNPYYFLFHQLIFGILPGIFLGFLFFKIDLEWLKKFSPLFLFLNLVLMGLVFLPFFGVKISGGARWLKIGPIFLQPSEFFKLFLILYLAGWLEKRVEKKFSKKIIRETFFAFLILIGIFSLFLVLQPDISTLVIIFSVSLTMFFLAKTPLSYTFFFIALASISLVFLVKIAPYRLNRVLAFFNPDLDPLGIGYQIRQSLITIGSGGILGKGLGMSQQKFGTLPQAISDTIFPVFAEETGFLGGFFLLLLFFIFFWRGFKIGKEKGKFEGLVAFGISFWIAFQAFYNIASMSGILPISGLPLPFVSYGGSHLISELMAVGILFNIAKK
jgi:cell division protein FtsW